MNKQELINRIIELKEEKNAVILAHYYQIGDIQDLADHVGDSLYLSKIAKETDKDIIVFCGVHFMAETAKLLSPEKTVIIPTIMAGCPMADMAPIEDLKAYKDANPDVAIISYVNTTAAVKALSDVCLTSSNARTIFEYYRDKRCMYVPDQNMGAYFKREFGMDMELWEGFCYVHNRIKLDHVLDMKEKHPKAKLIVHPEMKLEIVDIADFVGSTKGLLEHVQKDDAMEYIVGTEEGILHQMRKACPNKTFYEMADNFFCRNMKKITLENLLESLENLAPTIELDSDILKDGIKPLNKMFEIMES